MSRRFFSGPSLDRALLQAASHYDVPPDRIAYELVEKPGMTKRKAIVIKVDPENALKSEEETAPVPVEAPKPPAATMGSSTASASRSSWSMAPPATSR